MHHSAVPTLTKCIQLCLLVSLITLFHGPPCSEMICLLDVAWLGNLAGHIALPVADIRMLGHTYCMHMTFFLHASVDTHVS